MNSRFSFTLLLKSRQTYEGDIMYSWSVPKGDGIFWKAEVARIAQSAGDEVRRKAQKYHP